MGFGSSDMNPNRSITAKEEKTKICFLHAHIRKKRNSLGQLKSAITLGSRKSGKYYRVLRSTQP